MADDIEPKQPELPDPAKSSQEDSELLIATEVLRIRQEIELKALLEEGIDDVIRQPLHWVNDKLAWIAGIAFFCLISFRIAVLANFDITSISAVTQTANVQSMALQLIPVALPLVLLYFVQLAALRLVESRSHLATPIFAVIVTFSFVIFVALPSSILGLILIVALFVLCMMYLATRKINRKAWLAQEQITDIQERAKKLESDTDEYKQTVSKVSDLREKATAELEGEMLEKALREIQEIEDELEAQRKKLERESLVLKGLLDHIMSTRPQLGERSKQAITLLEKLRGSSRWRTAALVAESMAIAIAALTLFIGIVTAPSWLPAQEVELSTGQHLVAYQLERTVDETTLMNTRTARVHTYSNHVIVSEQICVTDTNRLLSQSLAHIALGPGAQPNYPFCVEGPPKSVKDHHQKASVSHTH